MPARGRAAERLFEFSAVGSAESKNTSLPKVGDHEIPNSAVQFFA